MNIKSYFIRNLEEAFENSYEYVRNTIFEYTKTNKKPLTILDIGCGWKLRTKMFLSKVQKSRIDEVHGIDVFNSERMPDKDIIYKIMNLENTVLPYKSEMFDIVICNQVIEHLTIKDKTLEEAYRVLKRGGLFILGTENISTIENIVSLIFGQEPINQATSIKKRTNSFLLPDFMQDTNYDNIDKLPLRGRELLHKNLCSYFGLKRITEVNGFRVEEIRSYGGIFKPFEIIFPFYNRVIIVKATK